MYSYIQPKIEKKENGSEEKSTYFNSLQIKDDQRTQNTNMEAIQTTSPKPVSVAGNIKSIPECLQLS